jgi:hypothetical protein
VLPLKRSSAPSIDDAPPPKRVFSGSSSGAACVGSEAIAGTVFDSTYAELQSLFQGRFSYLISCLLQPSV